MLPTLLSMAWISAAASSAVQLLIPRTAALQNALLDILPGLRQRWPAMVRRWSHSGPPLQQVNCEEGELG
jgi:hypothetical protein